MFQMWWLNLTTSFNSASILLHCTMTCSHRRGWWWWWWWCYHGCRELISHTHTLTGTRSLLDFSIPNGHHQPCTSGLKPLCWCVYMCVCLWTVATNIRRVVNVGACAHHISRGKQCHAVQCGNELRLRECVLHCGAPHQRGSHGFCGESIFFSPAVTFSSRGPGVNHGLSSAGEWRISMSNPATALTHIS